MYSGHWVVRISNDSLNAVINDHEKIIRLSPAWDVKALVGKQTDATDQEEMELDVEYDRTEANVRFKAIISRSATPCCLKILLTSPDKSIDFCIKSFDNNDTEKTVSISVDSSPEPDRNEICEFDLWARCIVNYLRISSSKRLPVRLWKIFLDRWWSQMTQSSKRITFFVVVSEGFSLVFLVALLLWWKFS